MKFKKILAAAVAGAIAATAATFTLPVSAASNDSTTFKWLNQNPDTGEFREGNPDSELRILYKELEDGTIAVTLPVYVAKVGESLPIMSAEAVYINDEISGKKVSKIIDRPSYIDKDGNVVDNPDSESYAVCRTYFNTVIVPDTVQVIDEAAFSYQVKLKEVLFGENSQLKEIGSYAFANCRSLEKITIPASVEFIGNYAFANNGQNLQLGEQDFTNVVSLTEVNFADNSHLQVLGSYVFGLQTKLTSITFPDGLAGLGSYVFAYCDSLKSVYLPKSLNIFAGGETEDGTNLITTFLDCPSDLTVYGYKGMAAGMAEQAANDAGIKFVALDEEDVTEPQETTAPESTEATSAPEQTTSAETTAEQTVTEQPAQSAETTVAETSANSADTEDGNQNTGVALLVLPAAIAAAGVMISKKRR